MDKTEDILRVLILEDEPTDAELAERKLREAGLAIQSRRVDRRETFLQALEEFNPGLVLCDFKLRVSTDSPPSNWSESATPICP